MMSYLAVSLYRYQKDMLPIPIPIFWGYILPNI